MLLLTDAFQNQHLFETTVLLLIIQQDKGLEPWLGQWGASSCPPMFQCFFQAYLITEEECHIICTASDLTVGQEQTSP